MQNDRGKLIITQIYFGKFHIENVYGELWGYDIITSSCFEKRVRKKCDTSNYHKPLIICQIYITFSTVQAVIYCSFHQSWRKMAWNLQWPKYLYNIDLINSLYIWGELFAWYSMIVKFFNGKIGNFDGRFLIIDLYSGVKTCRIVWVDCRAMHLGNIVEYLPLRYYKDWNPV